MELDKLFYDVNKQCEILAFKITAGKVDERKTFLI
jgi:hypothetical protein